MSADPPSDGAESGPTEEASDGPDDEEWETLVSDAGGDGRGSVETDESSSRHDRVTVHPTPGPRNSLWGWTDVVSPLRVAVNYAVIVVARHSPSLRLKNWLFRRLGMTVGRGVTFALESTPDVFWPELITVGDDAIVGYDVTILCHEFLFEEYRTGGVEIGERAMIGAGAVILPGVRIGADARVGANSVVTRDVPPGASVAGIPAEPIDEA